VNPKNRDPGAVKRIGFALSQRRLSAGMTRTELAKCGHTTVAYLEKIERGEVDPPLSLILKLGSSLGWVIR
jgi:predicted transcriptional regulator